MEQSILFINAITAFLILIIGLIFGKVISNIIKKVFIGVKSTFFTYNKNKGTELTLTTLVKWLIYILTIILALKVLGISSLALQIAVLVILVFLALFTILTFRDFIPNLIAGVHLRKTKKLKIGRTIITKNVQGRIINFNLLETTILNSRGEEIYLPNSLLNKEKFVLK